MLTRLKGVTDFRSHAKGHEVLCDVYYLLPVTCCDFISIHGRIARTQLLNKRTFVVWLKNMNFVTQNDAAEVGNNLPCCKNVLQAMVSNPFM